MEKNKKKIIIISVITLVLILSAISVIFIHDFITRDKKIKEQKFSIISLIKGNNETEDKRMIKQVYTIISQVKDNEKTEINNVYELEDIKNMGIDIPVSPYGTEYTKGSYIKNFNGIYYASFDNGNQKVSGKEDELEFSERGTFDLFWKSDYSYSITGEEKKIFVKEKLKNKYGEEFEIDYIKSSVNYLAQYDGDYGEAYPIKYGKEKSFDFYIYKLEQMTDTYYDILIEDEYKNLVMKGINKIDSNAKMIYFSNIYTRGYNDMVSGDLTLQEALSNQLISKEIVFVTYTNLKDKEVDKIKKYLCQINFRGDVRIYKTKRDNYSKVEDMDNLKLLQYSTLYSFDIYKGKVENEETKVVGEYGI